MRVFRGGLGMLFGLSLISALFTTGCVREPSPPTRPPYHLVILGDSISEGTSAMIAARSRWQDAYADHLGQRYNLGVTMRRYDGTVVGYGGVEQWDWARSRYSATAYAYWPEVMAGLPSRADELVVFMGANDEGQNVTPLVYGGSLDALIRRFSPAHCTVVAHWPWSGWFPLYDHTFYVEQARWAAARRGCRFVDAGVLDERRLTMDETPRIHPTQAGQDALSSLILAARGDR